MFAIPLLAALLLALAGGADARDTRPEGPPPAPGADAVPEAAPEPPDLRTVLRLREKTIAETLGLDPAQRREVMRLLELELDRHLAALRHRTVGTPGRPLPRARGRRPATAPAGTTGAPKGAPAGGGRQYPFAVLTGPGVHPALSGLRLSTLSAFLPILRPDQLPAFGEMLGGRGVATVRELAKYRRLLSAPGRGAAGGAAGPRGGRPGATGRPGGSHGRALF